MPLKWFTSYLNNRQQYVAIGHTESPRQAMTCGIPQGSTLGPLLFLLYINDLPNCSENLTFRIFVDDTNLFASARDLKKLETLINSELEKVKVWCDVNKLSINFNKSNYMIIKSNRKADSSVSFQQYFSSKHFSHLGCVSLRKSKIGFLNPKESENGFCVSLLSTSIQVLSIQLNSIHFFPLDVVTDVVLSAHGASKEPKNPLPKWLLRSFDAP